MSLNCVEHGTQIPTYMCKHTHTHTHTGAVPRGNCPPPHDSFLFFPPPPLFKKYSSSLLMVIIPLPHYDNLKNKKKLKSGKKKKIVGGPPPPPPPPSRSVTFWALAQHFRAGTAVARHFALPLEANTLALPLQNTKQALQVQVCPLHFHPPYIFCTTLLSV